MVEKLYIIGNGFDLHHQLKTEYKDFSIYLKENHVQLFNTLERFISYPTSDGDLWAKFEENLANFDADEILSENSNYLPDYSSDEFRDRDRYAFPDTMQQLHEMLTDGLFSAFTDFIREVQYPGVSISRKIAIDKSATFLTFNFTKTLERLYGIDESHITYIHNSAFTGPETIILGHGIDPEKFEEKIPYPPDDIEPEQYEDWYNSHSSYDYSYDEGKNNIMRYFKDTFKPTKIVIDKHAYFFKQLSSVKEIFVLGHSISPVDLPYFSHLVKNIDARVSWVVSYYKGEEGKQHLHTLTSIGIDPKNITLVRLDDFLETNRQLRLAL